MNKKIVSDINEFFADQALGPPVEMNLEETDNLIKAFDYNIKILRQINSKTKGLESILNSFELFSTSMLFRILNLNRVIIKQKNTLK